MKWLDTKLLRKKLGISQGELAILLEISGTLLSLFENGRRNLPPSALLKLGKLWEIADQAEAEQQNRKKIVVSESLKKILSKEVSDLKLELANEKRNLKKCRNKHGEIQRGLMSGPEMQKQFAAIDSRLLGFLSNRNFNRKEKFKKLDQSELPYLEFYVEFLQCKVQFIEEYLGRRG